MNALWFLWQCWLSHGTRILGITAGSLVTLCGTGIIPDSHLKYYMAAIALLTYWKGAANAKGDDVAIPPIKLPEKKP